MTVDPNRPAAPAQPANPPQPSPANPANGQSGEMRPDLAGYPSTEALVAAYRASGAEAKRWRDRAIELESRGSGGHQDEIRDPIPDRRSSSPRDELATYGVPVDPLLQIVREELTTMFKPIADSISARGRIISKQPTFAQFEADVAQFIESDTDLNQTYQRMFAADPVGAMDYAFLKFGEHRRAQNGSGVPASEVPAGAEHAAIPSAGGGAARRSDAGREADLQTLFERFQQSGSQSDARAYAKARLKGVISDDFLHQ